VGFSTTGNMAGTATSKNNAIICLPHNIMNPCANYDLLGLTMSTIVVNPVTGIYEMSMVQDANTTTLSFSRNATVSDLLGAQIMLSGSTKVIWAYGTDNTYTDVPLPKMDKTAIGLAKSSTPTVSKTASTSRSPTISVTISKTASPSAQPSPASYEKTIELTPKLSLSWNKIGDRFDFEATYSGLAW
jgi:hypothetical protein